MQPDLRRSKAIAKMRETYFALLTSLTALRARVVHLYGCQEMRGFEKVTEMKFVAAVD